MPPKPNIVATIGKSKLISQEILESNLIPLVISKKPLKLPASNIFGYIRRETKKDK